MAAPIAVTYYKRFRMEVKLAQLPALPTLSPAYYFVPWHEAMLDYHAAVKHRCFQDELDARIFPCLGDRLGCHDLMREIRSRSGFVPQATWLLGDESGYVGTVQGVMDRYQVGMIQNLGIVPEARGLGLGKALLLKALHGFAEVGLSTGLLEVTADNKRAVRLYRQVGFHRNRTVYKAIVS